MRFAVFSDLYPPLFVGGYELAAAQVVGELRRRGHEVLLLTAGEYFVQQQDGFRHARHTDGSPAFVDVGPCVFGSLPRLLRSRPWRFLRGALATVAARRRYRRAVADFRPERVLLFNPLGVIAPVPHDLAEVARHVGAAVEAYVGDDWPALWPVVNPLLRPLDRIRRAPRRAVRWAARFLSAALGGWAPDGLPAIDRFLFCSEAMRRRCAAQTPASAAAEVVPGGVPGADRLPAAPPDHFHGAAPLTLAFVGQIHERKGLDVLLRAAAASRRAHPVLVIGDDTTDHARACRRLAAGLGLAGRVRFLGKRDHAETLKLLGGLGHVLVVPSLWEEPFGMVVTEGMALGLPVVASDRGGPAEVIRHGDTGFLFEAGSVAALTATLDRLEEDRSLCARVGGRARRSVLCDFTIERMVDRLLGEAAPGAVRRPLAASASG